MQGINSSQTTLSHGQSGLKSDPVPSFDLTVEKKQDIRPCTPEELEQLKEKMSRQYIGSLAIAETKDIIDRIIKEWPPEQYTYVGIGRSPTLFIAEIQARLGYEAALNLPLSGFNFIKLFKEEVVCIKKLTSSETINLLSYFHLFLHEINKDKNILAIDFFLAGSTLVTTNYCLNQYLKEKAVNFKKNIKIDILGISDKCTPNEISKRHGFGINIYHPLHRPLVGYYQIGADLIELFYKDNIKFLAEYNQRVPAEEILSNKSLLIKRNQEYDVLVSLLATVEQDPAVRSFHKSTWVLDKCKDNPYRTLFAKPDQEIHSSSQSPIAKLTDQSTKSGQGNTESAEQHSQTAEQPSKKRRMK